VRRSRERGSALILFALCVVGILGIATLTIDLGLARMTQNEMQTAADASALGGFQSLDGTVSHQQAQNFGQFAFTDPSGQTVEGEGAAIDVDAGIGPIHASQLTSNPGVSTPPSGQYLQLNQQNLREGDIVTGTYNDDPTVPLSQIESASAPEYLRSDFSPNGVDANPAIPTGSPAAFLVRFRRVNSVTGAPSAIDNEPTVSSSGPALPYLFGHGAFISPEDPATGKPTGETATAYSPLRDGISVRATALAALRPATAVGWSSASTTGATPFAILVSQWNNAGPTTVAFPAFPVNDPTTDPGCYVDLTDPGNPRQPVVPTLGARIFAAAASAFPAAGYLPLYDRFVSAGGVTEVVIVGFIAVTVTSATATGVTVTPALDVHGQPIVLDTNATASVYDGFAWTSADPALAAQLLTLVKTDLSGPVAPALLQAPALVR
jgi:hypothetical protein